MTVDIAPKKKKKKPKRRRYAEEEFNNKILTVDLNLATVDMAVEAKTGKTVVLIAGTAFH